MKEEIKVIMRDGVAEAVLRNKTENRIPGVELILLDRDFPDIEELEGYAAELYNNPDYEEIAYTVAYGSDNEPEGSND